MARSFLRSEFVLFYPQTPPGRNPFMKFLTALVAVVALASVSSAQDLSNPDFETTWSSGAPPGWTIFTPLLMSTPDSGVSNCGALSCRLRTGTTTSGDFGKQWLTSSYPAIAAGDVLMGKFRVRMPLGQPYGAGAAYVIATGVNSGTGAPVGIQAQRQVLPSNSWQEITVYYVVPPIPAPGLTLRIGVRFANMPPGIFLWLDRVFFQGTSTSIGALQAPLCPEPDFAISSSGLRYRLHAYTGSVTGVDDTTTGNSYMPTSPTSLHLFELGSVFSEDPSTPWISNASYSYCVIRPPILNAPWVVETARNASTIPEASNLHVRVEISPSSTSSDIAFSMKVTDTNTTGHIYDEYQCPIVKLPAQLGASDQDDTVFVPGGDGWIAKGSDLFSTPSYHGRDYPGSASMQFVAYFDDTRGISLEAHDPDGECKQLGFQAQHTSGNDNLELFVRRRYPRLYGQTRQSYPVVVSLVSGPWENAAKHYRAWARSQPWATTPKFYGSAAWVREREPIYNADLKVMGDGVYLVDPTRWKVVMDDWATALDVPSTPGLDVHMTPLFRNFEHYGIYAGPYYATLNAPLNPSDTLTTNCWTGLLAGGHHTMAMVAGLKWLRQRDQFPAAPPTYPTPGGQAYWVQPFGGGACTAPDKNSTVSGPVNACTNCWASGQVVDDLGVTIDAWSTPFTTVSGTTNPAGVDACVVGVKGCTESFPPFSSWDGVHSWMCPRALVNTSGGAPYLASKLLGDFALHVASRGMQLFELDQMNGGSVPPCYSTAALHDGHPPGYGKWIYEGIAATMKAIRSVRQGGAYPDFAMTIEDPGELYLPYLDCVLGRPNHLNTWPADAMTSSLVVPAFQYVYSDLAPTHTADVSLGASLPTGGNHLFNQEHTLVELSRLFVAGGWLEYEIPPWMAYSLWQATGNHEPLSSHADSKHLLYLRHCVASLVQVARNYFDTGRMVSADGFTSPPFSYNELVYVPGAQCGTWTNFDCAPHTVDYVSHSAWKMDSSGCVALVLACASPVPTGQMITIPTSYDGSSYLGATYYVWTNGTRTGPFTLTATSAVPVTGLDVVVVTIGGSGC